MLQGRSLPFQENIYYSFKLFCLSVDYFHSPSGRAARAWKDLRQSIKSNTDVNFGSDTEIRFKLTKLHTHRPIFTDIIILVCIGFYNSISEIFLSLNFLDERSYCLNLVLLWLFYLFQNGHISGWINRKNLKAMHFILE